MSVTYVLLSTCIHLSLELWNHMQRWKIEATKLCLYSSQHHNHRSQQSSPHRKWTRHCRYCFSAQCLWNSLPYVHYCEKMFLQVRLPWQFKFTKSNPLRISFKKSAFCSGGVLAGFAKEYWAGVSLKLIQISNGKTTEIFPVWIYLVTPIITNRDHNI